ncbi:hypothetical protein [Saccharopolyspora phatthalungensis]|uniref:Uncharacterized protein n=1 Tax=Saccharopolyspora phatthalungensis TaxID=664693 RepID=A0A840QAC4_9PSEU|nr:hypothetical protein [Saccharopolyspora phatthalungensis]MBB5155608.1 hypothetical protein [Saccharopolyspora phatthalungensis]
MQSGDIVPVPPNDAESGPQTDGDEPLLPCNQPAPVRRYSEQSHLTLLLRQAEHAIRDACDSLIHSRCTDTELHDLAHGLEIVAGGVRGYLDTKDSTGSFPS